MSIVPDGAIGSAIRWSDGGYVAWQAPGNMYAQRGTLSFFWRSHTPAGETPFVIRSEEHTSELQSLMRISYAVFCLKKKRGKKTTDSIINREHPPYNNKHTSTSMTTE